jgi:hypothetical protein
VAKREIKPWTNYEDKIVVESMTKNVKRMSIFNAAKVASQYLEDEGYIRTPQAIAFRWSTVLNKKPKKEKKSKLELIAITPENFGPVMEAEGPEKPDFSLDFAIALVADKIKVLTEENLILAEKNIILSATIIELEEKIMELESIKDKYEMLKGFLVQNV